MKKLLDKKGFTIVEIIVTLAVLGIVIGPLMTMFITSQKINNESDKEYKSIQLAQQYMEEIKSKDRLDTSEYDKSVEGINTIYTKSILETENDYGAVIEIKSGIETDADEDSEIDFDAIMTVDALTVEYNPKEDTLSYTCSILGNVDFVINGSGVQIGNYSEIEKPLLSNKIKVILNDDAEINVTNNLDDKVELYIYNVDAVNTFKCKLNIKKGEVKKINNISIVDVEKKPDNVLYYITISVKKDDKIINTLTGTTIFKYKPN